MQAEDLKVNLCYYNIIFPDCSKIKNLQLSRLQKEVQYSSILKNTGKNYIRIN